MATRGGKKHGGRREGTPGKAYLNRTDLSQGYAPQTPDQTAAAGEFSGGAAPRGPAPQTWTLPDDVPSLTDPTARPSEDVTRGLDQDFGMPAPDYINRLNAAYRVYPTPELKRAINLLASKGIV